MDTLQALTLPLAFRRLNRQDAPMTKDKPARATVDDVARLAQVSTATVSRCLNATAQVNEATREKVMTAVRALNYTPNFGAKALAARRTNTIGAVIPSMQNAVFAEGVQAFQDALGSDGTALLIASSNYDPERERRQIEALVGRGAEGLLLVGTERPPEVYDYLAHHDIPFVITWAWRPDATHPCVGFDNEAAMHGIVCDVLDIGHRRIAMISGLTAGNDRAAARLAGARRALHEVGGTMEVAEVPYGLETGGEAFRQLMQASPTAVICGSDVLAVGAVQMAAQMGLRVPDDVSITGFDDIEIARIVSPPLTTVRVPHGRMGCEAARLLRDLMARRDVARQVELPTEIVMRGTLVRRS